ncbi:MAG: hypothetical protein U0269_17320 [Polyangiales bacterium]
MTPAKRALLVTALALALAHASLAYSSSFDLDAFDSAELALVAVNAGLGHPPSQPAHTMLGWLVTRGPWSPLAALAWLSIAPAVLSLWLALRTFGRRDSSVTRALVTGAVLVAMVGLGPLRAVATRVEVYALAALFAVGAMVVTREHRDSPRALAGAALLWGLAGATNPVIAAQAAWGVLAPIVRARRWIAALLVSLGAIAASIASYAYAFAARARETETLVWAAPSDLRGLWALLTARDFARNVSLSAATWLSNALWYVADLLRSGVGVAVALALFGLAKKQDDERDPWLGALAFSTFVGVAMVAANVPYRAANPDYGGYVLISCALAAAGLARLVLAASDRSQRAVIAGLLATAALLARDDGRSSRATRAIATRAIEAAPRGAIVVLSSDHLLFPMLYLQGVEGLRRDVTVLNAGWASSRWAWQWARAKDPSLVVDLAPGRARQERLRFTLRQRTAGRAVLSEELGLLALGADGELCPRGVLWSSSEGCDASTRSTAATVQWIRDGAQAARAARSVEDERLFLYTAMAMGRAAKGLGCAGLAVRVLSAALGEAPPSVRACGARAERPEPVDILTVSASAAREELERTRPMVATMR